jgi:hypothetical protein
MRRRRFDRSAPPAYDGFVNKERRKNSMRSHMRKRTLAGSFTFNLLCWAALALVAARAQEFRGTITGTVTDPQGGVVPNATVEIRNLDTNVVSTFRTNDSGVYVAPC